MLSRLSFATSRIQRSLQANSLTTRRFSADKKPISSYDLLNHVNDQLYPVRATGSSQRFQATTLFVNNYFNQVYFNDTSVQPVVDYLQYSKGLSETQIKQSFRDHMALRTPNIASGVSLVQGLIGSGAYEYKQYLSSNNFVRMKRAIQEIQIAGTNQVAVSLCATESGMKYGMPNYLFVSMRNCNLAEPDLYRGLDQPFETNQVPEIKDDPYWVPAQELTEKHGAGAANHFTLSINELVKLGVCTDIQDFRSQILNVNGCEENSALTVKDCPDVEQYALRGNAVYVEYLNRSDSKKTPGSQVEGFSTDTENINRIGGHVGTAAAVG
ncbi:hypothetical protein DID73_01845 [Candidatus Marinamargulisbacteria bacterium SCGC AG-343-K17]|nr:hypothetical protein DID73_01845 [Candidatus Marinamargulisbacteria bacterium SCGC AG-343-K17]